MNRQQMQSDANSLKKKAVRNRDLASEFRERAAQCDQKANDYLALAAQIEQEIDSMPQVTLTK